MSKSKSELDPKHESYDLFQQQISQDVWTDKYKAPKDRTISETFYRVAKAIYRGDTEVHRYDAYETMSKGLWMPGGRILHGAGLGDKVTLNNCYVSGPIEDSIVSIYQRLGQAMFTLSQYGGIGMDFSNIRPKGASVRGGSLTSPGVLAWMDLWHESAEKIQQAGHRRGAMMGVIADWHPDLVDFIEAKQTKGRLTNFNVSVLISDRFMQAVKDDHEWPLYRTCISATEVGEQDQAALKATYTYLVKEAKYVYVYKVYRARELWDMILKSTFEYSEPGVIFIDRINECNNLNYCETITCTNPCGEQPLPPFGTCNLGAINLARLVKNPFDKENAYVDVELLRKVVRVGVRFLDNVIDVSGYPLPEQEAEQKAKRRIGLGITGLADMIAQLWLHYDSPKALAVTDNVMFTIANEAYLTSCELAKERGTFPLWDRKEFNYVFTDRHVTGGTVRALGLRNGVLLTIAPTGTTSVFFGNVSSGLEPVFAHRQTRKVFRKDGGQYEYNAQSFITSFFEHCHPGGAYPGHFQTVNDLAIEAHLDIQEVCQQHIDASITKTINCPANMSYEDFKHVYEEAYRRGCKGCTTYKPTALRGSVIENADDRGSIEIPQLNQGVTEDDNNSSIHPSLEHKTMQPDTDGQKRQVGTQDATQEDFTQQKKRPLVIHGCTYKINWPSLESGVFLTLNENEGKPWEMFVSSKDLRNIEWSTATAVLASMLQQNGVSPLAVANQLKQIQGAHDGQWMKDPNSDKSKYYSSLPSYIGALMEHHYLKYETDLSTLVITGSNFDTFSLKEPPKPEDYNWDTSEDQLPRTYASTFEPKIVHGTVTGRLQGSTDTYQRERYGTGSRCPKCSGLDVHLTGDCLECQSCGWSKCS